MRTRQEIESDFGGFYHRPGMMKDANDVHRESIILEVVLDIRELLAERLDLPLRERLKKYKDSLGTGVKP